MFRWSWFRSALPAMLLVIPTVAAAQGVAPGRVPLRTALTDLATLRTEYVDAFNKKDASAVTGMYANDAVLILPDGTMLSGQAEIGKRMADDAKTWPHAVIKSDTVRVYGATAVDIGQWVTHPEGGGEQVARYVSIARRGMKGWKIHHAVLVPAVSAAPAK